ncbi:DDE-type integrase/transposase/recombinase [Streptosporangium canum]|uniref:DDE-type integrase/transposase/recombinase n=1 Tax=Streptosporangium canum TaxID=324952 RepID=UPI0036A6EBD2
MTADLRQDGERVNAKRVARLMRLHDIVGLHLRKGRRTTIPDPAAPPVPDLLTRDFTAGTVDERWCGDITYLPVGDSWLYLATVIDIGSRRLIGWSIAGHLRTELIGDALQAAVRARGGLMDGVIFHSDRGCQGGFKWSLQHLVAGGVAGGFGEAAEGCQVVSRTDSLAEAFNATLKRELLPGRKKRCWSDEAEARTEIFRWIA